MRISQFQKLAGGLSLPTILVAFGTLGSPQMHAAEIVGFAWTGSSGYSAAGSFSFNPDITPLAFSESGGGATKYLQSFTVSFFDPSNTLVETGSSVVNGVSSDSFFRLEFNTQTQAILVLDATKGGGSYKYFLTNLRSPAGQVVAPGVTGFNLFQLPGAVFLDSASDVRVTSVSQVPEPGTVSLLVLGMVGLPAVRRFRRKLALGLSFLAILPAIGRRYTCCAVG